MEPPSASPRAGRGPWRELLLAVSLLTSWNPLTTAQVTVESVPPNAAEGKDALLRVLNLPGDTAGLTWFRGEIVAPVHQIVLYVVDTRVIVPGPAYSGREIIYPNGSLLFQNITLKDTGSYILQIINQKFETALVPGQLRVFHERSTKGLPLGSIIGIALVVLIGVALVATLGYLLICTRTGRASGWCDLREFWCPASTPCHAPASSSISPDSLPSPTAEVPIYQVSVGNGRLGPHSFMGQRICPQPTTGCALSFRKQQNKGKQEVVGGIRGLEKKRATEPSSPSCCPGGPRF
ncbi:cell adhesion molecule CEACAM4-like isoform X5 [Canis lupus baileyi]|uniref:cell adhesion molecule CEACAM4-like isoform X5 n=1 Tax=Canis lupus baileyi TaxID=143281 RepID=UPI003B972EBC